MNDLLPVELDLITRGWPQQTINNYEEWFAVWRSQHGGTLAWRTEARYVRVGRVWAGFANGKVLTPRLMVDWHIYIAAQTTSLRKRKGDQPIRTDVVAGYHLVVKAFLAWMKMMGVIEADPSIGLPKLKGPPNHPARSWTHTEYRTMIAYLDKRPHLQTFMWLLILGYHTGMSFVDCCYLTWEEVTLIENGPCYINRIREKLRRQHGAKATCIIPIVPGGELWQHFKKREAVRHLQYKRHDGIEYVNQDAELFYTNPQRSTRMRIYFDNAVGGRHIAKNRSFRNLRNSFCTRLMNSGADAVMVSKITGHSNVNQLAHYVEPDILQMQQIMVDGLRWAEQRDGYERPPFLTLPPPTAAIPNQTTKDK